MQTIQGKVIIRNYVAANKPSKSQCYASTVYTVQMILFRKAIGGETSGGQTKARHTLGD